MRVQTTVLSVLISQKAKEASGILIFGFGFGLGGGGWGCFEHSNPKLSHQHHTPVSHKGKKSKISPSCHTTTECAQVWKLDLTLLVSPKVQGLSVAWSESVLLSVPARRKSCESVTVLLSAWLNTSILGCALSVDGRHRKHHTGEGRRDTLQNL